MMNQNTLHSLVLSSLLSYHSKNEKDKSDKIPTFLSFYVLVFFALVSLFIYLNYHDKNCLMSVGPKTGISNRFQDW